MILAEAHTEQQAAHKHLKRLLIFVVVASPITPITNHLCCASRRVGKISVTACFECEEAICPLLDIRGEENRRKRNSTSERGPGTGRETTRAKKTLASDGRSTQKKAGGPIDPSLLVVVENSEQTHQEHHSTQHH